MNNNNNNNNIETVSRPLYGQTEKMTSIVIKGKENYKNELKDLKTKKNGKKPIIVAKTLNGRILLKHASKTMKAMNTGEENLFKGFEKRWTYYPVHKCYSMDFKDFITFYKDLSEYIQTECVTVVKYAFVEKYMIEELCNPQEIKTIEKFMDRYQNRTDEQKQKWRDRLNEQIENRK